MNNIEFNTNLNLVQNSEEFKLILYKLSSDIYDFTRYNQPVLVMASLTFLVVFLTLVYYFDSKKVKLQTVKQEVNEKVNTCELESSMEKDFDNMVKSDDVGKNLDMELKFSNIKEEINELKKELAFLKINKKFETTSLCAINEENEDLENSDKTITNGFNRSNMEKTISEMTIAEIETFLQICSNHVLIPNWYTKEDFEGLTNTKLSTRTWEKILSGSEDYSSLIDETNAMTVGWFENNVSSKIEKVPYVLSVIEESDNEDSDSDEASNSGESENSDESELNLLEHDDSDEDNESESEESDKESDLDESDTNNKYEQKPNIFITKQLEKLKYAQLKKIAGVSNNKLTKIQLINLIAQDYKKVSIIKALNFIK